MTKSTLTTGAVFTQYYRGISAAPVMYRVEVVTEKSYLCSMSYDNGTTWETLQVTKGINAINLGIEDKAIIVN